MKLARNLCIGISGFPRRNFLKKKKKLKIEIRCECFAHNGKARCLYAYLFFVVREFSLWACGKKNERNFFNFFFFFSFFLKNDSQPTTLTTGRGQGRTFARQK